MDDSEQKVTQEKVSVLFKLKGFSLSTLSRYLSPIGTESKSVKVKRANILRQVVGYNQDMNNTWRTLLPLLNCGLSAVMTIQAFRCKSSFSGSQVTKSRTMAFTWNVCDVDTSSNQLLIRSEIVLTFLP